MSQPDLEAVAKETLTICSAGHYTSPTHKKLDISKRVLDAVERTFLLTESELRSLARTKPSKLAPRIRVMCSTARSGACAQDLLHAGRKRVAILNYANGVKPGGGFLHGARAQEEALCRCSSLYPCLKSANRAARYYYDDNRKSDTALVRGHVLVSPDVVFFRNEELGFLEEPFVATILTAAAPDLGWLFARTSEGLEPQETFDRVPAVFEERAELVFAAARQAGCDAIVAGPWGCGAFGNDPHIVADAFKRAVDRNADAFDDVVFSLYGPGKNREAFEHRFGMAADHLSFVG